jgi:DNA-damage-inducible protein D
MSESSELVQRSAEWVRFDEIKRVDERGEHWIARELMPVLGYLEWRKFERAIERSMDSARTIAIEDGRDPERFVE